MHVIVVMLLIDGMEVRFSESLNNDRHQLQQQQPADIKDEDND